MEYNPKQLYLVRQDVFVQKNKPYYSIIKDKVPAGSHIYHAIEVLDVEHVYDKIITIFKLRFKKGLCVFIGDIGDMKIIFDRTVKFYKHVQENEMVKNYISKNIPLKITLPFYKSEKKFEHICCEDYASKVIYANTAKHIHEDFRCEEMIADILNKLVHKNNFILIWSKNETIFKQGFSFNGYCLDIGTQKNVHCCETHCYECNEPINMDELDYVGLMDIRI